MLSALASAVLRCAWRRARRALGTSPFLAALLVLAVPGVPIAAAAAGVRLRPAVAELVADPALLSGAAVGVAAAGVATGVVLALAAPRVDALGPVVAAAPVSRGVLVLGATVAPALAVGALLALAPIAFGVALAGWTGAAGVAAFASCALAGAVAAEGARLTSARRAAAVPVVGAVAGLWAGSASLVRGAVEAGPASALVPIAADRGIAPWGVLAASVAAGAALWAAACAVPRRDRTTRAARRCHRRLPRTAAPAVVDALARVSTRHAELRPALAAALAVPVVCAAAARVAFGVGGEALVAFAVGLALVGALVVPPAAHGLVLDARWLFDSAPVPRAVVASAASTSGALVALGVVAAAVLGVMPFARADPRTLAELEAGAALVVGAAAAAGAVLPWRAGRAVEQVAAFGAAGACAVAAWILAAELVATVGAQSAAAAFLVGNAALVVGVGTAAVTR